MPYLGLIRAKAREMGMAEGEVPKRGRGAESHVDHSFGNILEQVYNSRMTQLASYAEMLRYVGFSAVDAKNVASLRDLVTPKFHEITEHFYAALLRNESARAVFTGGEAQIAHQRELLAGWLSEVFAGQYGDDYHQSRLRIGYTHLRVGLPQQYMCMGMQLIWSELDRIVRGLGVADCDRKLASLHKLLMLDLAIMLDSYKASYIEQTRNTERNAVEERLTQAEHLAEIGKLAASLAHEIKNPLAGISGAIQVIRDGLATDDSRRPVIAEILAQINRLDSAVRDLLLYARPVMPNKVQMPLADAVRRVLLVLAQEPALQQVAVVVDASGNHSQIHADPSQVEQLLLNLLINAAHALEGRGTVHVGIEQMPGKVRLTVKDSGVGMSRDVLQRAFEPFYTTKTRGTGLGLPICKRIVDTHGARIDVDSEPGKGTLVVVDWPVAKQEEQH